MANEITITQRMSLKKNNFTYSWNPGEYLSVNLSGSPNVDENTKTITTAGTNITLSNVTTPGYVALRNTDTTNFVDIGYDDSGTIRDLIRLKPGEMCMFRLQPARTLRGKADTASVVIQYMIFQD